MLSWLGGSVMLFVEAQANTHRQADLVNNNAYISWVRDEGCPGPVEEMLAGGSGRSLRKG